MSIASGMAAGRPSVFISYSHDGPEHEAQVRALAEQLSSDGLACTIDQHTPHPEEGWPRWMTHQIHRATFVILVCSDVYYKRVMGEDAPGVGNGVIWEANLIFQYIYDAGSTNRRFVPVLLKDASKEAIPTPLRGVTHYRIQTPTLADTGYRDLYALLTSPQDHLPTEQTPATLVQVTPLAHAVIDAEASALMAREASTPSRTGEVIAYLDECARSRRDPSERYWVYATLGAIAHSSAGAILESGTRDSNEFARLGAQRALGNWRRQRQGQTQDRREK